MDYPNIHDVLEAFECPEPISNSYVPIQNLGKLGIDSRVSLRYSFKHIQLTQKALAASTKTVSSPWGLGWTRTDEIPLQSIRTDADGLVSFQFLIPMAKGKADNKIGFVEFVVGPSLRIRVPY